MHADKVFKLKLSEKLLSVNDFNRIYVIPCATRIRATIFTTLTTLDSDFRWNDGDERF